MERFSNEYDSRTANNRPNFVFCVDEYFDEINYGYKDETKLEYVEIYRRNILPCVDIGKALDTYTVDDVEELILTVQKVNKFEQSTVNSKIRHLVYDPIKMWFKYNLPDDNEFDVTPMDFKQDSSESVEETMALKIVRSLSISEEIEAFDLLWENPETVCGEWIGLGLMLLTGIRNNEACGLNFGDLIEMFDYPGCYYIQITKSTEIDKNTLKIGGKTYNAYRRLPIVNCLCTFILKRKEYIKETVAFPLQQNNIIYNTVDELPIVCRKQNWGERASTRDLTNSGRDFLRNNLQMKKSDIAGLQISMQVCDNDELAIKEKDVTTYLLRRNMATNLYKLGFTSTEYEYYMGHKLENTSLERVDFGDETFLYKMWKKIQHHPLNNGDIAHSIEMDSNHLRIENEDEIQITKEVSENDIFMMKIRGKELNDSIMMDIQGVDLQLNIFESFYETPSNEEININKIIRRAYKKKNYVK